MYQRPYKIVTKRSSQQLCDRRLTKRFKGDCIVNFAEYAANLHEYPSGFGGIDPYNRYIEDDCKGEESRETATESLFWNDTPCVSLDSAVFSDFQEDNCPPIRKSINKGILIPPVPLTINIRDTDSVTSELSTTELKLVPCIVPDKRIGTTYDIRLIVPEVLGFLPDPNLSTTTNDPEFPWYLGRPPSPDPDEETYSDSESYNSEVLVLPQFNNYELKEDQKYLEVVPGTRNISHKGEGNRVEDLEVNSAIEALREFVVVINQKDKRIADVDDYGIDKWSSAYHPCVSGNNKYKKSYTVVLTPTTTVHAVGTVGFTVAEYSCFLKAIPGDRNSNLFKTGSIYLGHIVSRAPTVDLGGIIHVWNDTVVKNTVNYTAVHDKRDHPEIDLSSPYPKWVPSSLKQLVQKARTSPVPVKIINPRSIFRADDPDLRQARREDTPGFRELDGIDLASYSPTRLDRLNFVYQSLRKEWVYEKQYLSTRNQVVFQTLMNSCGSKDLKQVEPHY